MYTHFVIELFQKIPVELPNQPSPREKSKIVITCYVCGWYVDKLVQKISLLKKMKLSQTKKEENKIKIKLKKANKEWCDWKFQIHWNKLEWVNPRSRDERKKSICVSSKQFLLR